LGTLYTRSELRALVDFYTQNDFGILTTDEGHLIKVRVIWQSLSTT